MSITSSGDGGGRSRAARGENWFLRRPELPRKELERVRSILQLVARLTGWDCAPLSITPLDAHTAEMSLAAAQDALTERLAAGVEQTGGQAHAELIAALTRLCQIRISLRDAMLAQRTSTLADVRNTLSRLRDLSTVQDLITRAPAEVEKLGFGRALLSQIQNSRWVARSAYVRGDPDLAALMVKAGSTDPVLLDQQVLETDMVHRRQPILIRDAQTNPQVHPLLKVVTGSRSYVAAPIVSMSSVIGFMHADAYIDRRHVDTLDREAIGLFMDGLGYAIERAVFADRMLALRDQLCTYTAGISDLMASFTEDDMSLKPAGTPAEPVPGIGTNVLVRAIEDVVDSPLTRREIEVLRHMADGATNARIATRLMVSEGTVKVHVKHILRKLGATNRAEAVSRYLNTMQRRRPEPASSFGKKFLWNN
ncbi:MULTISPECIES: LuxR C-terminal-related transcriptional regulator [Protofrankia]|uniref:Transcriptional regulator, LuxR family n=3 Tax=Candidatus Protofrankia datiscae TaxID=2716812 RepID=F8AXH8_9ACTN|nr:MULTISPECIES: LuxR C-terminal-related transcriptional regulator [Protofrankia]AEH09465.1 transcriptional regulator, LuxR family [Candidatus Protofrankia datiscae]